MLEFIKLDKRRLFSKLERRIAWDSNFLANKGKVICGICNKEIKSIREFHLDHIEAYTRGGKTVLTNSQVSHKLCNFKKSSK